jgi:FkbM family methyltransferase
MIWLDKLGNLNPFHSIRGFVIYGGMRTGSNLLVSLLNQFPDVVCHGEAFNPGFVGLREDYYSKFKLDRSNCKKRDEHIDEFYSTILERPNRRTRPGFKMFAGHREDILQKTLQNKKLRKIILRRNLLTSFISLCQAEQSGVWMIKSSDPEQVASQRRQSNLKIRFDGQRFLEYRYKVNSFYRTVETAITKNRETALTLWYNSLLLPETINRLAIHLKTRRPGKVDPDLLLAKQAETALYERVTDVRAMVAFLDQHKIRGPVVEAARHYAASAKQPRATYSTRQASPIVSLHGVRIDASKPPISRPMAARIRSGHYEVHEAGCVRALTSSGDSILELGGGIGLISSVAGTTQRDIKITVVEANPELIPIIRSTHQLNGVMADVINGVAAARAPLNATTNFYIRADFWASSLSPEPWGYQKQISVPLLDVQRLLDDRSCTFVICDVEGAEVELIPSLTLTKVQKILVEFHPRVTGHQAVRRVFRHLGRQGFQPNREFSKSAVIFFERARNDFAPQTASNQRAA